MGQREYGALGAMADEFLGQRKEERTANFQAIRDKRLSELKMAEATHTSELAGGREADQRDWNAKNYTAPLSSNVVRDGEKVQEGEHRPAAGSYVDPRERPIPTRAGYFTTLQQTEIDYATEHTTIDEYGNKITKPGSPSLTEYRNNIFTDDWEMVLGNQGPGADKPPQPSSESIQEATAWAEKINSGFTPLKTDKDHFGGLSQDEAIQKKALELDKKHGRGTYAVPGGGAKVETDGMLTESEKPKETKPKVEKGAPIVLTLAAKTDPDTMYYELMDATEEEDYSEEEIIAYIRDYFDLPTWDIPLD